MDVTLHWEWRFSDLAQHLADGTSTVVQQQQQSKGRSAFYGGLRNVGFQKESTLFSSV